MLMVFRYCRQPTPCARVLVGSRGGAAAERESNNISQDPKIGTCARILVIVGVRSRLRGTT